MHHSITCSPRPNSFLFFTKSSYLITILQPISNKFGYGAPLPLNKSLSLLLATIFHSFILLLSHLIISPINNTLSLLSTFNQLCHQQYCSHYYYLLRWPIFHIYPLMYFNILHFSIKHLNSTNDHLCLTDHQFLTLFLFHFKYSHSIILHKTPQKL